MSPPTLAAGDRFGAYEVVEPVGAGGMGEVYRARDTRLSRDVALKVLPDHRRLDPRRRARVEREAQLLSSLNHPNIATLHGIEESAGSTALVMELVEGETLADMLSGAGRSTSSRSGRRTAPRCCFAIFYGTVWAKPVTAEFERPARRILEPREYHGKGAILMARTYDVSKDGRLLMTNWQRQDLVLKTLVRGVEAPRADAVNAAQPKRGGNASHFSALVMVLGTVAVHVARAGARRDARRRPHSASCGAAMSYR